MKQLLSLALIFCAFQLARSANFSVNGMNFNLVSTTDKTVEITYDANNQDFYFGDIEIPEKITYKETEYTVVKVGAGAFKGCTYLFTVTLPPSITEIGGSAFYNCI